MRNDRIINLFYPRRCPVCDEPVPGGEGLACRKCRRKIQYVTEPRCKKCGRELSEDGKIYCKDCETANHLFDYGYALYDYQSMKQSIYRFKYHNRCEYAKFYAQDIYAKLGPQIMHMGADGLIPVPLHKSKLKARGYNQAELVAKELSGISGIPMYANLVERVKKTIPQKELEPYGRQNNLKKAFHITSDVVKLNKTIVVDDIYTTGSTIDAVTEMLRQQGVRHVYFITLCIGEGI